MKKEDLKNDNSFGIAGVSLGISSIVLASFNGLLLGIVALVFAMKQQKKSPNSWGKNGKIVAIVGIILSILSVILSFWIAQNPQLLASIQ